MACKKSRVRIPPDPRHGEAIGMVDRLASGPVRVRFSFSPRLPSQLDWSSTRLVCERLRVRDPPTALIGDRLTVGRRSLDPAIKVRILVPERNETRVSAPYR
jgi:hypothetical protein